MSLLRLPRFARAPLARGLAACAFAAACATVPPAPSAPTPTAPPDAGPPSASADAGAPVDAQIDGAAAGPPAVPPGVVGATPPRLPWVNPARCLSPCRFAPAPLMRINDQASHDDAGLHQVEASVQPALQALLTAAQAAGHTLRVASAYRSYDEQARLFRGMKEIGRAARPGHSEHQLGSTIDLRLPTQAAIDWLAASAPAFGFALSYPPGKQKLTGYRPEPWHVRYVGREAATEIGARGITLEEFFRAHPDRGESGSCADCPAAASRTRCGRVTAAGTCRGTVLTWCYEGALATVDCKVSQQTCGRDAATGEASCLLPTPAAADASRPR
jgi:D-alanyl-D-alanine carboxypeptidase